MKEEKPFRADIKQRRALYAYFDKRFGKEWSKDIIHCSEISIAREDFNAGYAAAVARFVPRIKSMKRRSCDNCEFGTESRCIVSSDHPVPFPKKKTCKQHSWKFPF